MAPDRRSVLGLCAAALSGLAGCFDGLGRDADEAGSAGEPSTAAPAAAEAPPPDGAVTPPDDPGGPVLAAWWVEYAPGDADVSPSDEPPVSEHDVLLGLFDEAVEQRRVGETAYGAAHGAGVYDSPSEATYEELSTVLAEKRTPDERPYLFFEHGDSIVRLLMTVDD